MDSSPLDWQLPEEVALEVFKFFDARTLAVCSRVCSMWNALCNDNSLWKHLVTKSWKEKRHARKSDKNWIIAEGDITKRAKKQRNWKQFYRWCESENIRWKTPEAYELDLAEAKKCKDFGLRLLAKDNIRAAKKALEHSRRLFPDADVDVLLKILHG